MSSGQPDTLRYLQSTDLKLCVQPLLLPSSSHSTRVHVLSCFVPLGGRGRLGSRDCSVFCLPDVTLQLPRAVSCGSHTWRYTLQRLTERNGSHQEKLLMSPPQSPHTCLLPLWVLNVLKSLCVEGLVLKSWCYRELMATFGDGA